MTITLNRTPKGQPTGGEFSSHNRDTDTLDLSVQFGDTLTKVTAAESRAFIEASFVEIDNAWLDEDTAENLVDEAAAAGKAHAHAEIVAFTISDNLGDYDYEAQGERMLNDRREGHLVEQGKNFVGPGELTAMKRQLIVDHCRRRADELFDSASTEEIPDAAAHLFGRSEAFAEVALDISADSVFYTGD